MCASSPSDDVLQSTPDPVHARWNERAARWIPWQHAKDRSDEEAAHQRRTTHARGIFVPFFPHQLDPFVSFDAFLAWWVQNDSLPDPFDTQDPAAVRAWLVALDSEVASAWQWYIACRKQRRCPHEDWAFGAVARVAFHVVETLDGTDGRYPKGDYGTLLRVQQYIRSVLIHRVTGIESSLSSVPNPGQAAPSASSKTDTDSHAARTSSPSDARLSCAPEAELARLRVTCEREGVPGNDSFGSALDLLAALGNMCSTLHAGAGRSQAEGNYCDAAGIAWLVAAPWGFAKAPDRPSPDASMTLRQAQDFITRCQQLFLDRSRREYWKWRHAASGCLGGDSFVKWHLDNVLPAWRAETADLRGKERAKAIIARMRTEFGYLHELWAEPHHSPDYLCVAVEAHKEAADVQPERPAAPEGRHAFAQLDAYLGKLLLAIDGRLPFETQPALAARDGAEKSHEVRDDDSQGAPPLDPSAYLPAAKVVEMHPAIAKSPKVLARILRQHPEIRRWKPNAQRLLIHAGDWQKHVDLQSKRSRGADGLLDDQDEVEQRKALMRAAKQRPKRSGK
jgi:hypothetical protein